MTKSWVCASNLVKAPVAGAWCEGSYSRGSAFIASITMPANRLAMNPELLRYIKIEAAVGAAFNFFINGMVAGLIYHGADAVATDPISLAIDLACTCVLTGVTSALFIRASLRGTKTLGILPGGSPLMRWLARRFGRPALFGLGLGLLLAVVLYIPTVLVFGLAGIQTLSFFTYIALKCVFAAALGAGVTALEMYAGLHAS